MIITLPSNCKEGNKSLLNGGGEASVQSERPRVAVEMRSDVGSTSQMKRLYKPDERLGKPDEVERQARWSDTVIHDIDHSSTQSETLLNTHQSSRFSLSRPTSPATASRC